MKKRDADEVIADELEKDKALKEVDTRRERASRRISTTQFGKMSYNDYLRAEKDKKKKEETLQEEEESELDKSTLTVQ